LKNLKNCFPKKIYIRFFGGNLRYISLTFQIKDFSLAVKNHRTSQYWFSFSIILTELSNSSGIHLVTVKYVIYLYLLVMTAKKPICQANKPVLLTHPRGNLASIVSAETGCGTALAPWMIQVLPGQRINVTLLDFIAAAAGSVEGSIAKGGATMVGGVVPSEGKLIEGSVQDVGPPRNCR